MSCNLMILKERERPSHLEDSSDTVRPFIAFARASSNSLIPNETTCSDVQHISRHLGYHPRGRYHRRVVSWTLKRSRAT